MEKLGWGKIAAGLGCAVLGIAFIFMLPGLLLGGMLIEGSVRTVYERETSPDGSYEARVQFDDAGAVSRYERVVFLKRVGNPSDAPLLSCLAFWGHGEADIDLSWRDDRTLIVEHHVAPENIAEVKGNCGPVRIVPKAVKPFEKF